MSKSESVQLQAIRRALALGYTVDTSLGVILDPEGHALVPSVFKSAKDSYPRVSLCGQRVSVHKVVAYALWGDAAFAPGVHVRHLNGDRGDASASNLALGTPSQNAYDKPDHVRSHMARVARAAQGPVPHNRVLDKNTIDSILADNPYDAQGRVITGFLGKWAARLGITKAAISMALKSRRIG